MAILITVVIASLFIALVPFDSMLEFFGVLILFSCIYILTRNLTLQLIKF
jgi:hypothetical protein